MSPLPADLMTMAATVIGDRRRHGSSLTSALSAVTDDWLRALFAAAVADHRDIALVAVGGYGRAELCPGSDLDLVLVHRGRKDIATIAESLWYPIWDQKVKLGHAVRTVNDALTLAKDDLDTATALLDVRLIAGDAGLAGALASGARQQWERDALRWLTALRDSVSTRAQTLGELAFLLEPDLKESRGGLRDAQALRWAGLARPVLLDGDAPALECAYEELLATRVELHRSTGRRGDVLTLQEQDAVAEARDLADADALMAQVAGAARTIALIADEVWEQVEIELLRKRKGRSRPREDLGGGLMCDELGVHVVPGEPIDDAPVFLRAAAAAAKRGMRIDRRSLERLALDPPTIPTPWSPATLDAFVELLLAGHHAIPVIEALDQRDLWVHLLPEWAPNRNRPQRNAYHRFTVDRHLWEAATEAAALTDRVRRPDLLVLGALLHDIGKGYPGDHTEAGMAIVPSIAARLGLDEHDTETIVGMVEHHLLLPDVATRRDLDDEGSIALVARAAGNHEMLDLLWALTEADSIATGTAAWGEWKAQLVALLVDRTHRFLDGHQLDGPSYPTDELLATMERGEIAVQTAEDEVSVVAPDRLGLFSRIASVLSLHGLDIRAVLAGSSGAMACSTWSVSPGPRGAIPWDAIRRDLDRALRGRLAIDARLAERAETYRPRRAWSAHPVAPRVTFDNDISETATVLEVQAADRVGLLARLTRSLADVELDIRRAMVQTLGGEVVDTFYVCDADGRKILDAEHQREIRRAVLHALGPAGSGANRQ